MKYIYNDFFLLSRKVNFAEISSSVRNRDFRTKVVKVQFSLLNSLLKKARLDFEIKRFLMVLRRSRFPLLVHKLIRYIFQNVFHEFFRERSCYFSDNSLRRVLNLMNYLYKLRQYMSSQYSRMKRTKTVYGLESLSNTDMYSQNTNATLYFTLHRRIWDFI